MVEIDGKDALQSRRSFEFAYRDVHVRLLGCVLDVYSCLVGLQMISLVESLNLQLADAIVRFVELHSLQFSLQDLVHGDKYSRLGSRSSAWKLYLQNLCSDTI
jgi:hypothetical protein